MIKNAKIAFCRLNYLFSICSPVPYVVNVMLQNQR